MSTFRIACWAGCVALLLGRAVEGQTTVNNPHGPLRESCATCHRAERWRPARISAGFRHAPASFPLEGAHTTATCVSCHRRLDFKETSATCASCHSDVHKGELGAECARCHSTRSFVDWPGMMRMHERTRFPLRGAHVGTACESCHPPSASGTMRFVNRPSLCVDCHRTRAETAIPDHHASGFSSECGSCHSTATWSGARFDHARTAFVLTGAHRTAPCAGCHADAVYRGKSTECYGCHRPDYEQTQAIPHAAAGFATTCGTCHTTTGWTGAAFNHDANWFPIYSGKHRGRWTSCSQCHSVQTDFRQFTCLTCHEHDQTKMDDKHRNRAGYRYESVQCYACHPRS